MNKFIGKLQDNNREFLLNIIFALLSPLPVVTGPSHGNGRPCALAPQGLPIASLGEPQTPAIYQSTLFCVPFCTLWEQGEFVGASWVSLILNPPVRLVGFLFVCFTIINDDMGAP